MESFQIPESFDTSRNFEITFWAKHDDVDAGQIGGDMVRVGNAHIGCSAGGDIGDHIVVDPSVAAIPYMRSTEACYVNKTYVEALGYTLPKVLTWDYVWEVAEAATAGRVAGDFKGGECTGPGVVRHGVQEFSGGVVENQNLSLGAGISSALLFMRRRKAMCPSLPWPGTARSIRTI